VYYTMYLCTIVYSCRKATVADMTVSAGGDPVINIVLVTWLERSNFVSWWWPWWWVSADCCWCQEVTFSQKYAIAPVKSHSSAEHVQICSWEMHIYLSSLKLFLLDSKPSPKWPILCRVGC